MLSDFNLLIGIDVLERLTCSLQGVDSWGKVNEKTPTTHVLCANG
jgi:hypothetical protein